MRTRVFAWRNLREILRDPLSLGFSLGFPVVLLLMMSLMRQSIPDMPADVFGLESFTPGMAVFGLSFLGMFLGMLMTGDRKTAFLQRLDVYKRQGYHCGYITPIPHIEFDHILSEEDFKTFIEAMSNDVLNWETAKETMRSGGITYADKTILIEQKTSLAEEVNGAKFITGGNLGINLTFPERLFPFYNPPGARGEDTFLSTCLKDVNVKHIPSYTFHDGFAYYRHLLKGVLPNVLKPIDFGSEEVINRF